MLHYSLHMYGNASSTLSLAPRESGWWLVGKGKGDEGGMRVKEVESGQLPRGVYYSIV